MNRSRSRAAGRALLSCLAIVVVMGLAGRAMHGSGMNVSWGLLALLGFVIACLAALLVSQQWPRTHSPSWSVDVDRPLPRQGRERRAARLANQCRGASPSERFTTTELRNTLRTITARRLVRRHGADPAHPFGDAAQALSPELFAYLTGPAEAPALRRSTLAAHLKEIDAL